tara:strand:+ start:62 stop:445 length:384 start_codon:yes stop_codon:yes gene_type:complete
MINTKLVNIYLLLFIIFVCVSMTSIVILSNNKDINNNINCSLIILIVIFFTFILVKIIINKDYINYKFDYNISQLENNNYLKYYQDVINNYSYPYNVDMNNFYKKLQQKKPKTDDILSQFINYSYNI